MQLQQAPQVLTGARILPADLKELVKTPQSACVDLFNDDVTAREGKPDAMGPSLKSYYPSHTQLGECPLYRPEDKTLHYIDVLGKNIHILDLSSHDSTLDRLRTIPCPESITFMGFCANPPEGGGYQYIVCYFQGIATVNETDGSWNLLKKIIPDEEKHLKRLNDGAIDSRGRLWFGTIDISGS